jgi:hypothetical protein
VTSTGTAAVPGSTAPSFWSRRGGTAIILTLVTLVGAAASVLKVPESQRDIPWAEDAGLFLVEAVNAGPWNVIVDGYAGYQHLIPRVMTALVLTFVPLSGFAVAVLLVCALLTGLIAAAVYWLSRDLVPWIPARIALASITFLIPSSSQEVVGNLADIHSYCMWLVPWIMLSRPRSWGASIGWAVVVFACAMTEIQSLLFLPLILLRLHPRSRMVWPISVAFAGGIAWQVATTLLAPRASDPAWPGLLSLVEGYLINTTLPMYEADPTSAIAVVQSSGVLVPALVLVPFAVAAVVAFALGSGWQRVAVVTMLVGSVGVYAGGAIVDGTMGVDYEDNYGPDFFDGYINLRYGVPAGMLLAATVPVLAGVLASRVAARRRSRVLATGTAAVALAALVAGFVLVGFGASSSRGAAGTWSEQIDALVGSACVDAPPGEETVIAYAPAREITLTCAQVLQYER